MVECNLPKVDVAGSTPVVRFFYMGYEMKNKSIWLIATIFIIGIILRLLFIDKTSGLSYDELVSYKQASQTNILSTIFYTLKTDVHMPLYQIFLHLWAKIFSLSDLSLRAFSAFCGILTIIVSFYTGKELAQDKNTGILCATLFSINSFLIYYSQEVRMYSLLILLASITILIIAKIKNNPNNRWNYVALVITSFAIIHTYTIAFIYVVGLLLTVFIYQYLHKQSIKNLRNAIFTLIILCIPVSLFLFVNSAKYTNQINGYYCDWSSLFIILQDTFTPVLDGIANNPTHYMHTLFTTFTLSKFIFILIPTVAAIYGIVIALKKDKFSYFIIAPATLFLIAEIVAFKFTNFKILPRYAAISMPAFIIIAAYGFSFILNTKKKINLIIPTLFIGLNLIYLVLSPNAAYKIPRLGFRPLANLVNQSGLNQADFILVWNRKEILDKYLDKKVNIISTLKDFAYKSEVMLANEKDFNSMPIEKRKEVLKPYFQENKIPYNTSFLMNYIITNMYSGQKFIITTTENFNNFDKERFKYLVKNSEQYKNTSLNDLLTIKSLTDIKEICNNNLKYIGTKTSGEYVITIYAK